MFKPDKSILKEYAMLGVVVGTNVQKGQLFVINAPVEAYELVRECVDIAYKQGASRVIVNYLDDQESKMHYEYMEESELCDIPSYIANKKEYEISHDACYLHIIGEDPDLLKDIDSDKVSKYSSARMKFLQKYQDYTMNNIGQWSIITYPNLKWAKKVFKDENDDEAMNKLWEVILSTSRCKLGKTKENWNMHNKEIREHAVKLNEYNFKTLHFKNKLGTDLEVGLIKNHIWEGGADIAKGKYKVHFNPNIPTEEVFTMPDRRRINGKVVSSLPFSYNGNIISSFSLTFKDGQIVEYDAKDNYNVLKNLIELDKGTKSLGEVALISYNSPIQNSNILFYETLFDENASCHLAIGACYPTNVKNGSSLSRDELYELGGNDSMEHADFMFGTSDMSVVGKTYDGKEIIVFENGNFVF